jgi:hypothetical protein
MESHNAEYRWIRPRIFCVIQTGIIKQNRFSKLALPSRVEHERHIPLWIVSNFVHTFPISDIAAFHFNSQTRVSF